MKLSLASLCLTLLASAAIAQPAHIADLTCNNLDASLVLKYIDANDDGFSEPNLPRTCQLGKTRYEVSGERGSFKQGGPCGAQPPVSISVSRNGKPLIVEAVFGDNCFHGPAITSIEIVEAHGSLRKFRLCVLKEPGSTSICKALPVKGHTSALAKPIEQSALETLAPGK